MARRSSTRYESDPRYPDDQASPAAGSAGATEEVPPQSRVEGGPENPLELGKTGWRLTLKRAMKEFKTDRCTMTAGSLAYHWFLALFPAVIALLGLTSLAHVGGGTVTLVIVWTVIRWVITIIAVSLLFSVFYYIGPNRPTPRWQWVSPGGVVGSLIFFAASVGFSFYVAKFGNYGKTYGTFAGVAILIFWLYLTGIAVLLGAEINAEAEREAAAQAGVPRARAAADSISRSA